MSQISATRFSQDLWDLHTIPDSNMRLEQGRSLLEGDEGLGTVVPQWGQLRFVSEHNSNNYMVYGMIYL